MALQFTNDVVWVALAVTAGYAVALALLVAELLAVGGGWMFRRPSRAALEALLPLRGKVVAAVTGGLLGGQVFVFLERLLAASLGVGAVAAISYSRGVAFTPNVLAQSVSLGLYPGMLRAHAERNVDYLRGSFVAGLRVTLFVAAAAAAYLAWFAPEVTVLLFDRETCRARRSTRLNGRCARFPSPSSQAWCSSSPRGSSTRSTTFGRSYGRRVPRW